MSKILDAEDKLGQASLCSECLWIAAGNLDRIEREEGEPLQAVADVARAKITEAIALLVECRTNTNAGPVPAAFDAKPKSPAARRK
jgi:hypothetical protein